MPGLLEGKVVLVTGSAQQGSIGEAIVRRVAQEGALPIVTSREAKAAQDAVERLARDGHEAAAVELDVTDDASVSEALETTLAAGGRLDAIVHNAGFPLTQFARGFLDVDPDEYGRVFDVDVVGGIRLTRAALPHLVARGGSLVWTSSAAALQGYRYLHEFAPSKAGLVGIARGLAAEMGRHGLRSNVVAYGNIRSPATWDALDGPQREELAAGSAMRRWGETSEAAGAVLFLVSDLASFVNGQVLFVDGGSAIP